jgi:TIR domain/Pentapeptide repeats (8 copies)
MANPEHLQILEQGVEAWNQWREQNGDIRPDLSRANLSRANLFRANLRRTDLRRVNLIGANLDRANLGGAILGAANLGGAILREAILRRTDLRRAHLDRANLDRAHLGAANLGGANLAGANLSHGVLFETVFGDTDLTMVKGLETCDHLGPSILDHRTLAKSGPLPLAFLRGCGLPEALIDYLPSLLHEAFQFYSCFISYASQDHAFAERLYADLQNKGVRCWFAPEDMKIGDRLRPRIDETIHVYDKLLLVLSKASVTSQWVEQEVETALARERQQGTTILFPVRIDNTVMALETGWPALIRNTRNIGDFRRWKTHDVYQKAFDRLLRALKAAARQPEGSRPVG